MNAINTINIIMLCIAMIELLHVIRLLIPKLKLITKIGSIILLTIVILIYFNGMYFIGLPNKIYIVRLSTNELIMKEGFGLKLKMFGKVYPYTTIPKIKDLNNKNEKNSKTNKYYL